MNLNIARMEADPNANPKADDGPVRVPPQGSGAETVYELGRSPLESPTSHVVSERVQTLASQIYNELQKIMSRCSDDEEAVSGLMPLVVNVLESLDLALIENQQLQVELELCKDDNEQLVTALDKEKSNKKRVDQRLIEMEFQTDEEKQQWQQKVESLESTNKMLELRSKTIADQATRLEDKESELKSEYNKLHTRYTELLRSHCDLMERVKILIGSEDTSSSGPASIVTTNVLRSFLARKHDIEQTLEVEKSNQGEISSPQTPKQAWIDTDLSLEDASIIEDIDEIPKDRDRDRDTNRDRNERESHSLTGPAAANASEITTTGMEKEVENLILENNELLATKNALNIVKDDLIARVDELQSELTMSKDENQQLNVVNNRLKNRIQSLEDDFLKMKQELEECRQKLALMKEDDESTPMVNRKRFTRLEMARVLMERNQYKEKLIELQEAVRWTELIRASKTEGEKKSPIWKFFSNLFTPSAPPTKESPTHGRSNAVRFNPNNAGTVTPALDAMRKKAKQQQNSSDLVLLMDSDLSSERARALRNVRANVSRTNGDRVQAYGWSIASSTGENQATTSVKNTSVPVPVYCRPLSDDSAGLKIWCASAVDLSGGEAGFPAKSGSPDQIYAKNSGDEQAMPRTDAESSKDTDSAIADLESELNQALSEQIDVIPSEKTLSTFVWICSVSNSKSKVTIVNIRSNPSEVLDSFVVKTHLLCVASVPGAKNSDLLTSEDLSRNPNIKLCKVDEVKKGQICQDVSTDRNEALKQAATEATEESVKEVKNETLEKLNDYVAYAEPPSPTVQEDVPTPSSPVYQAMSTCLPTMWLGGQNKQLYVHSSIAQWSHCIASIKLPDSIVHIAHYRGRVFIALNNGQCCVFMRSLEDGEWNFNEYYLIDIGQIAQQESDSIKSAAAATAAGARRDSLGGSPVLTATSGIRCIEVTRLSVWLGYRNQVFVLDPKSLKVIQSLLIHPRRETQVRHLATHGDGVWCSLRLDSTLRLYSAYKPFNHLQDVDIEPYVSKMLSPKAFSFIRITSLKASNGRLWIGTANGVILSIPCENSATDGSASSSKVQPPIVSTNESGRIAVAKFIPTCNTSAAQLSFHGHKDAVKFFVSTKNLILSGGDGYIDFRLNTDDDQASGGPALSKGDRSHLIVWEINS